MYHVDGWGEFYCMGRYAMTGVNGEDRAATVLVVDDEPYVLEMLKQQLLYFGYNIITARNGMEALQKAEKFKRIDILLTDIMMPFMNGIELAKEFNKLFPATTIFFMSGYISSSLDIDELPDKNYTVFEKPFSLTSLTSEFARVLSH